MAHLEPGQRVHYVLPNGSHQGECRAALVVRVIDPQTEKAKLFVLTDGLEDSSSFFTPDVRLSAHRGACGEQGRWHFRMECPSRHVHEAVAGP